MYPPIDLRNDLINFYAREDAPENERHKEFVAGKEGLLFF